jgi:hypothetical protein
MFLRTKKARARSIIKSRSIQALQILRSTDCQSTDSQRVSICYRKWGDYDPGRSMPIAEFKL